MLNVRHRSQHLVTAACLALAVAACGTAQGGSPAPASPAKPAPTPAATATVQPAGSPTAVPSPVPALTMLWEASGPTQPTPCCESWMPAIDPRTGYVWVANSFADEFWIFKPDGTFVESWGTSGTGDGQFDFDLHRTYDQATGGIAFAPDGSFYVADSGNHRVQAFDAQRHHVKTWGTFGTGDGQFGSPMGIVTDGTTVSVADDDRGDVQAFDLTGNYLRTFGMVDIDAGIFMAVAPDGSVYRAGPGDTELTKFDAEGHPVWTAQLDATALIPDALTIGPAVAPDGHVFVNIGSLSGPGNGLVEVDENGKELHLWSTGGESGVVAPTGDAIYVGNESPGSPPASLRKFALPTN